MFFSRFAQPHLLAYRIKVCGIAAVLAPATLCAQVKLQAHAAERFLDSMGVNVHMEYTTTPYGNYGLINERLRELGMHHIRDEINNTAEPFVD